MCEFDPNEDTFSVYFDELEDYFIENRQKEHTWGVDNSTEISRLWFKKQLLEICLMRGGGTEQQQQLEQEQRFFSFLLIELKVWGLKLN